MTLVTVAKLRRSKVYTRSGSYLGRLDDLVIESDQVKVSAILVAPSGLIKKFLGGELQIAIDQVIEFSEKKITVEDGVLKDSGQKIKAYDYRQSINVDTEPIISSDQ